MEQKNWDFLKTSPEGALIVALDDRMDGLLYGAVELRSGDTIWLDYELESTADSDVVSLYRGAGDEPLLAYCARGRRAGIVTPSDRLLILWNRGRRALAVEGDPLSPGEAASISPQGTIPWLLRFASWLPGRE